MKNRSKYLDLKDGTLYFRRFKKRYGMLPGKRGSPEFNDAWDRYFAQSERDRAGRQAPQEPSAPSQPAEKKIGTVAYFIRKFLASEFFVSHHGKAPKYASGTIINYKAVLERMALDALPGQKEPIGQRHADRLHAKKGAQLSAQDRRALSASAGAHPALAVIEPVGVCDAVR